MVNMIGFRSVYLIAGCFVFTVVGAAQVPASVPPRPIVRATGEASVSAKPDQAQIDIGVVTQAHTAEAAGAQNARQLQATLDQLKKVLGPGADIKTVGYSLSPNYRYPREGGQPAIVGYTATNTVQVMITDLAAVAKVIDAATLAGANNIQRLNFTLKDEQAVRAQALKEAAVKARAQADAIAGALGVKVVRVLSAEQGEPMNIRPLVMRDMRMVAEAATAPTPVEPGTIEVRATVTLTLEISQ